MTGAIPWGGVRKAVKRKLVEYNNIVFTSNTVGEEALYSFRLMICATTFGYIEKPVYQYVQRKQSLSRTKLEDPYVMLSTIYSQYIKDQNIIETYTDTINAVTIMSAAVSIDRIAAYSKNYQEFKIKALERWEKACSEISYTNKIDLKHMSLKSRIIIFLIKNKLFLLAYATSKLKTRIKG